jgi:hypothetical protein
MNIGCPVHNLRKFLTALFKSGLDCFTRYNNIPTPLLKAKKWHDRRIKKLIMKTVAVAIEDPTNDACNVEHSENVSCAMEANPADLAGVKRLAEEEARFQTEEDAKPASEADTKKLAEMVAQTIAEEKAMVAA